MSWEFCRDILDRWGYSKSLFNKQVRALFHSLFCFHRKMKGRQLKGKIVPEIFTLFHNFHTFSDFFPQVFPLLNKGL